MNFDERKDYNLYRDNADMTTTHEAFQFLIRKFVETNEGVEDGLCLNLEDSIKKRGSNSSTRRGSIQSLDSDESNRQSR